MALCVAKSVNEQQLLTWVYHELFQKSSHYRFENGFPASPPVPVQRGSFSKLVIPIIRIGFLNALSFAFAVTPCLPHTSTLVQEE